MTLSSDFEEKLRKNTFDAAQVFLDDIRHIRTIMDKEFPTAGDIRRLCAQLRRMLVEGEILAVATPRIGKIAFEVPYSPNLEKLVERDDCFFLSATIAEIFGIKHNGLISISRPHPGTLANAEMAVKTVALAEFLSDKVIWAEGRWITRVDVLKFVAYHGYGIHFKGKKQPIFDTIRRNKRVFTMSVDHAAREIAGDINTPGIPIAREAKARAKRGIDLPSLHLFGTAKYLIDSPNVHRLERFIEGESDPD